MEDRSKLPIWAFDQIQAAVDEHGLPGVAMRVSRTTDDGLPTFMYLSKAKQLRDALDAAIARAEAGDIEEPPFPLFTMDM